jgi:hypothetical protein
VVGVTLSVLAWMAVPQLAAPVAISFAGKATDGTTLELTAHVTEVDLSRLDESDPGTSAGGPGSEFLNLSMTTDDGAGTGPSFNGFDAVPASGIQLALPGGAVVPVQATGQDLGFLEGSYSFVVPTSTTSGTLEVTPGTVSAVEYPGAVGDGGALTHVSFQPSTAVIVVPPPPPPVTSPVTDPVTSEPVGHSVPPKTQAKANPKRHTEAKGIAPVVTAGASAGGGLVVLVLVIPLWRRRAYRKADSEGRVVIDSPPARTTPREPAEIDLGPSTLAADSDIVQAAPLVDVEVRILGAIDIDGLARPLTLSPVRELLVFLALHPGRQFTAPELRNAIWVEGRTEPKPSTFHNYLSRLRHSLPAETLVRTGYHYALTDAVTSDWGRFGTLIDGVGDRVDRLQAALALVRGAPFEGAFSGRDSPYAWAGDLTHQVEAAVEKAGHELVALCLQSGDPVPADAAVARVLVCVPGSVVAREDFLRVGSALGGPREVGRRLDAARHSMGDDAHLLEPLAQELAGERA